MERSVEEQDEEIRELEEKIARQRGVLEQLRGVGVVMKREKERGEGGADMMET